MKKIMTLLVITVFVAGMVPLVSAGTLAEDDAKWVKEYNNKKAQFQKMKNFYTDARQDWLKARNKLREYNEKGGEAFQRDHMTAKESAKDYLLKAIDVMDKKLETIQYWGENQIKNAQDVSELTSEISAQRADLASLRAEVEAIDPASEGAKQELSDAAGKAKTRWNEVKTTYKKWVGVNLAERLNMVLERFTNLGEYMHRKLAAVDKEDPSYAAMEAQLEDYDQKVDLAQSKYDSAKSTFKNINNINNADSLFRDGKNFLENANTYLKDAHKILKDLTKQYKASQKTSITSGFDNYDGAVSVTGTGRITAGGNGTVSMEGKADLVKVEGDGELTIVDNAGLGIVTTVQGEGEVVKDGDTYTYNGNGKVRIIGGDVTITFEGTKIDLSAEGTGTVSLEGEGWYKKGGKEGKWPIEIQVVGVATAAAPAE